MLFHSGNSRLEIQAEFLDLVESTPHQNAFIQPTPLGRTQLLVLRVSIRRGALFQIQQVF